ncbi:MAG: SurA N-terminal domain-containing protein [Acidobacteriia bacterium]|nr:SurA N-terminal domain-containing protein [Terriglobia bacterium]
MIRSVWLVASMLIFSSGLQPQTKPKVVERIVAQVNDDIITLSDLNREMAKRRQELADQYTGDQLEQELKKTEDSVLEDLIRKRLILQKATELGMGSGMDVQVSAYIEQLRKQNGIKDMDEFERALEQQGMTLAGFREDIKKEMIIQDVKGYFVDSRITILSEEIERYYKDHTKDYSSPEEVTLSEIVVPSNGPDPQAEALANEYRRRALQGESFATLASQYSKGGTAGKGGGIGTYQVMKLKPDIANAVTAVKEGDVSLVVKIAEGYAIFRVDARKPSVVRPFGEVKDDIKKLLYQQKFVPEFERFIAQLKEDAYIQKFPELGIGK